MAGLCEEHLSPPNMGARGLALVGLVPRNFLKYDIQICRFWCILTAVKSLILANKLLISLQIQLVAVEASVGVEAPQPSHGLATDRQACVTKLWSADELID